MGNAKKKTNGKTMHMQGKSVKGKGKEKAGAKTMGASMESDSAEPVLTNFQKLKLKLQRKPVKNPVCKDTFTTVCENKGHMKRCKLHDYPYVNHCDACLRLERILVKEERAKREKEKQDEEIQKKKDKEFFDRKPGRRSDKPKRDQDDPGPST